MKYTGESNGLYGEAPEAILNDKQQTNEQEHESEERHLTQTQQFYEWSTQLDRALFKGGDVDTGSTEWEGEHLKREESSNNTRLGMCGLACHA